MNINVPLVALSSDHAGYKLKHSLLEYFSSKGYKCEDLGPYNEDPVDYPDQANKLAEYMKDYPNLFGILICGTGIGVSIAANRYKHIRAALCHDQQTAELARMHNDANILCLAGRFITKEQGFMIAEKFLSTNFGGGRHITRVKKLTM